MVGAARPGQDGSPPAPPGRTEDNFSMISERLVSLVLGVALLSAAPAVRPALAADVLSLLPQETLVPFLRGFSADCVKRLGDSNFGRLYCPCAAAIIADRFTLDEATDEKIMASGNAMDKVHPGTSELLKVCALAARPAGAP
jgi:hypothetical protein